MKNETFIPSDELVASLYNEFLNNESIISISALRKKHGYGSKSGGKIQRAIYTKYGEAAVKKIALSRCSKYRRSKITGTYRPSPETLAKRSKSIKLSWERPGRKEFARIHATRTIVGRIQTEEEKIKRANSNRGQKRTSETCRNISVANKGRIFTEEHKKNMREAPRKKVISHYLRTNEMRKKLSIITKKQWVDGIHKPTYRSKGQIEIENIIKGIGYEVKPEFLIEGRPYDTLVVSKNLLIEYNGTFWHRDPRFFHKEQTHRGNCLLTEKNESVWKRDAEKIELAKRRGYKIVVIWEHDWKICSDKEAYIKNILQHNGL